MAPSDSDHHRRADACGHDCRNPVSATMGPSALILGLQHAGLWIVWIIIGLERPARTFGVLLAIRAAFPSISDLHKRYLPVTDNDVGLPRLAVTRRGRRRWCWWWRWRRWRRRRRSGWRRWWRRRWSWTRWRCDSGWPQGDVDCLPRCKAGEWSRKHFEELRLAPVKSTSPPGPPTGQPVLSKSAGAVSVKTI